MDQRLTGMCAYCGAEPDTRDHVPSKVLLDEPYPAQLPVVDACVNCNAGFSLDEQYLACLLECVLSGTALSTGVQREKIRRTLLDNPHLKARIAACERRDDDGNLTWTPEADRIRRVVMKLARGHTAYEFYPTLEAPDEVAFAPLSVLSEQERTAFEDVTAGKLDLWPELGSRAFLRAVGKKPDQCEQLGDWFVVQPGRYRYAVVETGGVLVRIVLSEYLACMVA